MPLILATYPLICAPHAYTGNQRPRDSGDTSMFSSHLYYVQIADRFACLSHINTKHQGEDAKPRAKWRAILLALDCGIDGLKCDVTATEIHTPADLFALIPELGSKP